LRPDRPCGVLSQLGSRSRVAAPERGSITNRPTGRGAPVGPRALERTQLRPLNARHHQAAGVASASRTLARCSHWAATTRLEDQDLARGLPGIYGSPFGPHVYCAASNRANRERIPACDGCIIGRRRKKKAQPEKVALKVPPKEEVLEECVSARRAVTHQNYPENPPPMQAFSAAMRHIVDARK